MPSGFLVLSVSAGLEGRNEVSPGRSHFPAESGISELTPSPAPQGHFLFSSSYLARKQSRPRSPILSLYSSPLTDPSRGRSNFWYTLYMKPIIFLLCGMPFSGKTTYAKKLEKDGVVRFTLDEELFKRFGRHFKSGYPEKEKETKRQLKEECKSHIKNGVSVIFDFGFWKKEARDEYKAFAEQIGATWKLLYFPVSENELKKRLEIRNKEDLDSNHFISEEMLDDFIKQFETPQDEGEEIIKQDSMFTE